MERSPVAKAYDFTKSGAGEYSVKPSNRFTIVNDDGTLQDLYATVGDTPKVKLSGDLPPPRVRDKQADPGSCSPDRVLQLGIAGEDAKDYARNTYFYLTDISSGTTRYTTWFGEYDEGRKNTVEEHFGLIDDNDFSSYTYDCTCTDADTYAYVCACIFRS